MATLAEVKIEAAISQCKISAAQWRKWASGQEYKYPWLYLAQDANGDWYVYQERPRSSMKGDVWTNADGGDKRGWLNVNVNTPAPDDWDKRIVEL